MTIDGDGVQGNRISRVRPYSESETWVSTRGHRLETQTGCQTEPYTVPLLLPVTCLVQVPSRGLSERVEVRVLTVHSGALKDDQGLGRVEEEYP